MKINLFEVLMKKTIPLLLIITVLLSLPLTASAFNGLTPSDALTILRAIAGITELTADQTVRFDLNSDGTVDSLDAVAILRISAGLPAFPPAAPPVFAPVIPLDENCRDIFPADIGFITIEEMKWILNCVRALPFEQGKENFLRFITDVFGESHEKTADVRSAYARSSFNQRELIEITAAALNMLARPEDNIISSCSCGYHNYYFSSEIERLVRAGFLRVI
jgi:hypothetical protein